MIRAVSRRRAQVGVGSDCGFTLIELLVVIVILGVLSAVVVFSVRGIGDRGEASARAIDARTLRTANEASCAQDGFYRSGQELANDGFLSEPPVYHQVEAAAFDPDDTTLNGNCTGGEPEQASYRITCDASLPGCGEGGATALAWQQQTVPALPGVGLNDVSFVDTKNGWAVGNRGGIVATDDGGETWTSQTSGTIRDLWEVDFVDASSGWAVGWRCSGGCLGVVLRTTDGGATWTDRTPPAAVVADFWEAVDFVTGQRGVVGGLNGAIATTSDGGATWSASSRPLGASRIKAFHFVDDGSGTFSRGFGVAAVSPNNFLLTDDGGQTWTDRPLHATDRPSLQDITFASPSLGWAVGIGNANMFATTDGGVTWKEQPRAPSNRSAVAFISDQQGWAVGQGLPGGAGEVVATVNGGVAWNIQEAPTTGVLNGVDFVDSVHGWAVSRNNVILAYGPASASP